MLRAAQVLGLSGVLWLCGCVESQPGDVLGKANFISGAPRLPGADYGAPTGTAGTGAPSTGIGSTMPAGGTGAAGTPPPDATAGMAAPVTPPAGGASGGAGTGGTGGAGAQENAGTGSTPTAGSPADEGMAGGMAEPTPDDGTPGMLMVSVTTAGVGGRYAPRNCGAIWIETASGQFVKTIERWAAIRAGDLRGWNQASGGWGFSLFGSSTSPDAVDAVSAATLTRHQAHNPTWAFKDGKGMVVPDGTYKVKLEIADGRNVVSEVSFEKGSQPQTVTAPAGGQGYTSFTVTYTP